MERVYGRFERSFTFPTAVAPDGVEAEADHGVLLIRVAKAKDAQTRKIAIRATRHLGNTSVRAHG